MTINSFRKLSLVTIVVGLALSGMASSASAGCGVIGCIVDRVFPGSSGTVMDEVHRNYGAPIASRGPAKELRGFSGSSGSAMDEVHRSYVAPMPIPLTGPAKTLPATKKSPIILMPNPFVDSVKVAPTN